MEKVIFCKKKKKERKKESLTEALCLTKQENLSSSGKNMRE